ncbi:MAG TPA: VOC family protein [Flavobacteriaceae bacterium]|nr:VOC family protein [Flavobacteriaceae bacterium]
MTKEYWINLPIKDLKRSKKFFTEIGFTFNTTRETETMTSLVIGKAPMPIMFFEEKEFEKIVQSKIGDTSKGAEIIISFDAESRNEIDEMAEKVRKAGGEVFSEPEELQGWMYNVAFKDLDGHRWNMLYMDMEKMPK